MSHAPIPHYAQSGWYENTGGHGHATQVALDPQEQPGACYGGSNGVGIPRDCARNAPKELTVKIVEYKDRGPFFVKGESDEP
jgi:hypothetical protein